MTVRAEHLEARARSVLPDHVWRYVSAGALDEITTAEAVGAWRGVRLRPHVLRDVRVVDTAATLLGHEVAAPIGIAPTSMQRWVHPDGEVAMLTGARAAGLPVVVSTNAGTAFADLGRLDAHWWLQAYLTADRDLIAPVLVAAAEAGARAVVLTVDTPFPGPKHDIAPDDVFGDLTGRYGLNHPDAVRGRTPGAEHARDLGPADLARIAELTGLPVVVKGVLRPDDAALAVDAGAAAVWVSNHGGRQLDRAVATADALPAIRAALGCDVTLLVDGGIRGGLDVATALALGADAAFLGRLPLYALADGGADGVTGLLTGLRDDLADAMRLAGCRSPGELPDLLAGR